MITTSIRLGNWIGGIRYFDQWGRLAIEVTSFPMGHVFHFQPGYLYWITCLDDVPLHKIARMEGRLCTILKFTPQDTHPEWLAWVAGNKIETAIIGEPFANITLMENDTLYAPLSFPDYKFPDDYPGSDYRFQIYLDNQQVVFKKE